MFGLFNNRPTDIKGIRNALLQFIKEQLQKAAGGEGRNITGLYLYLTCSETDRFMYEAAVSYNNPGLFQKEDIQKIADDYAIELPEGYTFEMIFDSEVPAEATRSSAVDAALVVSTFASPKIQKSLSAFIHVLNGTATKGSYALDSKSGKITIGRGVSVQTAEGFFRKNTIAFTDAPGNSANRAVSRQHAHIEWDGELGSFFLYADEGGVPPGNKVKVKSGNGSISKLMTTAIGHRLEEGDQVILGESAVLEFSFLPE